MKRLYTCQTCKNDFYSTRGCVGRTPKFCSRPCSNVIASEETRRKQSEAKLGRTPWNKGVAMWTDRPHPKGTLGKKLPHQCGERSRFWRGGVSSENERARKSAEYRAWRSTVYERDDFTCQICHKRGGKLHADHIKPFALFPELRFEVSNGRTLCVPCHLQTDTYGGKMLRLSVLGLKADTGKVTRE